MAAASDTERTRRSAGFKTIDPPVGLSLMGSGARSDWNTGNWATRLPPALRLPPGRRRRPGRRTRPAPVSRWARCTSCATADGLQGRLAAQPAFHDAGGNDILKWPHLGPLCWLEVAPPPN